jgi:hypothetical protein
MGGLNITMKKNGSEKEAEMLDLRHSSGLP